ncbi:Crp/Fnr family transcriptional regulator [Tellurirhabdus rosea]|uniref:Crp/Fnr family transcriptional regulator n=1 Tax=Tellurirhabdus rosea TaxID=2674997 RepID=UPI0022528AF3|nr:Crp/Fnr family transcriptional regulator [Tellurirhabdus rosea]
MERLLKLIEQVSPLPEAARHDLQACFHPVRLPKGEYFVRAGELTYAVAFVQEGVLRAFITTGDGTEYNKTFFAEDDLLAVYYSFLQSRPSHLSVQALTACTLLVADYRHLEALYDRHPALERFARRQAEWLFVLKEQREIDLVLLDAAARYEKFRAENPDLEQRIPQYHIASHLGITPTQLSRIRAGRLRPENTAQ